MRPRTQETSHGAQDIVSAGEAVLRVEISEVVDVEEN
jgi:hypothetical protein